jgi:ABC-type lipoprotein release transport system permease subunit
VLVTVAAGIFGLALLVSLRPALQAARVDLVRTLREE